MQIGMLRLKPILTILMLTAAGVTASAPAANAWTTRHRHHAYGHGAYDLHHAYGSGGRMRAVPGNNAEGAGNNGNSFYGSNNLDNGNNFGSFR